MTTPLKLFLGGTFDPVHIGHARLALRCHQATGAPVFFVPCADPPHKPPPVAGVQHRLAMLNLVVAELNLCVGGHPAFLIDQTELAQPGPSYTLLSLQRLRQRYPQERLAWLIGMDSLATLDQWHQWRLLTDYANLLVVERPGYTLPANNELADWLRARICSADSLPQAGAVALLPSAPLSVASRDLRRDLADGECVRYLVPDSVLSYIQSHQLYT